MHNNESHTISVGIDGETVKIEVLTESGKLVEGETFPLKDPEMRATKYLLMCQGFYA